MKGERSEAGDERLEFVSLSSAACRVPLLSAVTFRCAASLQVTQVNCAVCLCRSPDCTSIPVSGRDKHEQTHTYKHTHKHAHTHTYKHTHILEQDQFREVH